MNVINIIQERRSYRGAFEPKKPSREDLKTIMEAGLAAPSGCNKQTTSLIGIDNDDVIEKIFDAAGKHIAETASAYILVLSQDIIAYDDRCFSIQDYSAAIENMLLAAEALGYSSCWYEGYITKKDQLGRKIADALGVPKDYNPVCLLPIGVAVDKVNSPKKKSFEERAWFNGFKNIG